MARTIEAKAALDLGYALDVQLPCTDEYEKDIREEEVEEQKKETLQELRTLEKKESSVLQLQGTRTEDGNQGARRYEREQSLRSGRSCSARRIYCSVWDGERSGQRR